MNLTNATTTSDNIIYITNCSELPPKNYSTYFPVIIYFMYSVIFVFSILGNGSVCYIVVSSPRMRTVTNYFIMNLAVGDILITVLCIPFTTIANILQYWPFSLTLCPIMNYTQGISVFVSAYTLVAISMDRYVAIMWPMRPRLTKGESAFVIFSVWMWAMITAFPMVLFVKTTHPSHEYEICDLYLCHEDWSSVGNDYNRIYTQILVVLQYVIPLSVLVFTYTSIAVMIWCHRTPGEAETTRDQRIARSKKKMIKMMITVVVVHTICWLPFNLFNVIVDAEQYDAINQRTLQYIWYSIHWFAMSHTCYNPIIYCYMNSKFREGYKQAFGHLPFTKCCALFGRNRTTRTAPPTSGGSASGGTDISAQRVRTCTTYVSIGKNSCRMTTASNLQEPIRSASVMKPAVLVSQQTSVTKRRGCSNNVAEEQI